jgi:hypothetical protein
MFAWLWKRNFEENVFYTYLMKCQYVCVSLALVISKQLTFYLFGFVGARECFAHWSVQIKTSAHLFLLVSQFLKFLF